MSVRQKTLNKIEKVIRKDMKASKEGGERRLSQALFGEEKKEPFCQRLKSVATNKVFVSLCFSLSGLYFVVTGVQYWTPNYLLNVLDVDEATSSIFFSVTSFTAPISGVIVGGIATTSLGGYNTRKA